MNQTADNRVSIPFGVTVVCRRCKTVLQHGDVAYNDGKGYLYCAEHNPKLRIGPAETKGPTAREMKQAMLNPIPGITAQEVRDRIEELRDANAAD